MFKVKGKLLTDNKEREIILTDEGKLTGDVLLYGHILNLSKEWEFIGCIPGINYEPPVTPFYKDKYSLFHMMNQICTDVKISEPIKVPFASDSEVIY